MRKDVEMRFKITQIGKKYIFVLKARVTKHDNSVIYRLT